MNANSMANQVTKRLFDDIYSAGSQPVQRNNSWMAEQMLGEFIIEGAAPTAHSEAEEASMALQNLISFVSRKAWA
jgi:hypothetical protein